MKDNERMTEVLKHIIMMKDATCLRTIGGACRDRREELAKMATATWKVGDEVQMLPEHRNSKPYGAKGTIKKINKVKMKVDFPTGCWNIPKSMLMKAE